MHPALAFLLAGVVFAVALILLAYTERSSLPRAVVRLPVVQVPQRCGTCTHWNVEEGKAAMARHPAFNQAREHVSPAEMAYGYKLDENGERAGLNGPTEAGTMRWEDFGACRKRQQLVHESDTCELYLQVPPQPAPATHGTGR